MLFQVSKNNITVLRPEVVNEGEYNVSPCEFNFDSIYSGLVKKAVFTNYLVEGNYEVPILNNKCIIPSEVLTKNGNITLGVYAYEVQGDELKLRYSPTPVHIEVNKGSFIEGTVSPEEITPSQFEQYMQAMEDGLEEVDHVNINAEKSGSVATVTITNRYNVTKSVQIKDGSKGDTGPAGPVGPAGPRGEKVIPDPLGLLDLLDLKVKKVIPDLLDLKVKKVIPDLLDLKVKKVIRVVHLKYGRLNLTTEQQ